MKGLLFAALALAGLLAAPTPARAAYSGHSETPQQQKNNEDAGRPPKARKTSKNKISSQKRGTQRPNSFPIGVTPGSQTGNPDPIAPSGDYPPAEIPAGSANPDNVRH